MTRDWTALALLAITVGCSGDSPEPFAFLEVRLDERPDGDLRAAIFWADHGAGGVIITDDQRVPDETTFALSLATVPPEDALRMTSNQDGPTTFGRVVAYLDRDGDGGFDWTSFTAPAFRDEMLGWAPGFDLVYAHSPSPLSPYTRGLNLVEATSVPQVLPLDSELVLRVFGVPEMRCFGMNPPPASAPRAVSDLVTAIQPQPRSVWPYGVGVTPCEGAELPRDWWRISCGSAPNTFLVTTVEWPANEDIAALCGWTADYCEYTLPADAEPSPELPSCE